MAVKIFTGTEIEYISPLPTNLTSLSKSKNLGKNTGSKKKGHVKNAIIRPLVSQIPSTQISERYSTFLCLKELIIDFIDTDADSDRLFEEEQITPDPFQMSDDFIKPEFDLNKLKSFFDNDAWSAVQNLHQTRQKLTTCKKCLALCFDSFIKCYFCLTRIHFDCDKVNQYYR